MRVAIWFAALVLFASPAFAETFTTTRSAAVEVDLVGSAPWSSGLHLVNGSPGGPVTTSTITFAGGESTATHIVDATTATSFGADWADIQFWINGRQPAQVDGPGTGWFIGSSSAWGGGPWPDVPFGKHVGGYSIDRIEVLYEFTPFFNRAELHWKVVGHGVLAPEPSAFLLAAVAVVPMVRCRKSRAR